MLAEAGRRDKLVTIEQATEAEDETGFPMPTWASLINVWMLKRDLSGAESLKAAQLSARFDTEWEMPYLTTMDPDGIDVPKTRRLNYRGRTYDIQQAVLMENHDGKGIKLFTLASAKQS